MCLSTAAREPERVTGKGEHAGFEWMVLHNGNGYRCGYIRVSPGHPWHGQDYDDVRAADGDSPEVHGGLTFAEADVDCGKGGPDNAWWLGFDCVHGGDAPDRSLPCKYAMSDYGHVWTQPEVEAECRSLCEQAARVAPVVPVAVATQNTPVEVP